MSARRILYVSYLLQVRIVILLMSKTIWLGASLVVPLGVFVGLSGYGIFQPARIEYLFSNFAYYIILGVCIVWVSHTIRIYKKNACLCKRLLQSSWKGLIICLLITVSLCSAVKPHFRVLDDETSLLSVSNSMTREHKALGVTQAKYSLNRDYIVLEQYVPKRPLLFPFFVHLTHLIRGQQWQNGFLLNAILLFACLALIYLALRIQLNDWGALAGVLLLLTNPIFIISARSSGFDFLSVFFFLLSLIGVYIFLRKPNSESFGFLWSTLLMFSHIRYENIYLLFVVAALAFILKAFRREHLKNNVQLLAWTPTLLLPYIWQIYLSKSFFGDGVVSRAFGFDYLLANTKRFVISQGNLSSIFDSALSDFAVPTAAILGILIVFFSLRRVLRFANEVNYKYFTFLLVASGTHLLILLGFYFGDITLTYMQRIYLPVFSLLALAPLLLPWVLGPWINTRHIFIAAVILFIVYLPISLNPQRTGLLYPDLEFQIEFLRSYNPRTILIMTARPVRLNALGYGAINFDYANKHKETVLGDMQTHAFSNVLAFQRIKIEPKVVEESERLDAEFLLEPMATFRVSPGHQMRVSRVTTMSQ